MTLKKLFNLVLKDTKILLNTKIVIVKKDTKIDIDPEKIGQKAVLQQLVFGQNGFYGTNPL